MNLQQRLDEILRYPSNNFKLRCFQKKKKWKREKDSSYLDSSQNGLIQDWTKVFPILSHGSIPDTFCPVPKQFKPFFLSYQQIRLHQPVFFFFFFPFFLSFSISFIYYSQAWKTDKPVTSNLTRLLFYC